MEDDRDGWVEAIAPDGTHLGWLPERECKMLGIRVDTAEIPERWLEDPYILVHAQSAYERGLLTRGQDLSSVQMLLLASVISRRHRDDAEREEARVLAQLAIHRPQDYEGYMARKRAEEAVVEESHLAWTPPEDFDELLRELEEGGIDSFLSPDDLSQLADGEWHG